jgi:hypothetical protein
VTMIASQHLFVDKGAHSARFLCRIPENTYLLDIDWLS